MYATNMTTTLDDWIIRLPVIKGLKFQTALYRRTDGSTVGIKSFF